MSFDDYIAPGPFDPREWRFFYFSYSAGGGAFGSMTIRQKQQTDGQPDDGFNVAQAHSLLLQSFGIPMIIIHWTEITHRRWIQWNTFLKTQAKPDAPEPIKLCMLSGGNEEDAEKSSAQLKVIHPVPEK